MVIMEVQRWAFCCLMFVAASFVLQGCGGGGTTTAKPSHSTTKGPGPSPSPGHSTTTTTMTTTFGPRTQPLSSEDAAKYFNEQYMGFDPSNQSSEIGVLIQMHDAFQFFCKSFGTKCYKGEADCRVSTSLFNKDIVVNTDGTLAVTMNRLTGVAFNTSMAHQELAKCAWQYDGATDFRFNGGCGCVAPAPNATCTDHRSAFYNLDPATYRIGDTEAAGGKECTDTTARVIGCHCDHMTPPTRPDADQCMWKGVAFYKENGEDQIWNMIHQRLAHQGHDQSLMSEWNEIVIDADLLHDELVRDPAVAIPAIVYVRDPRNPDQTTIGRKQAKAMAEDMARQWGLTTPVPLVGIDPTINVTANGTAGPFVADSGAFQEFEETLV